MQWLGELPGALDFVGSQWVIGIAGGLYAVEFLATMVPGIASVWETLQTFIRPPLAALLAGAAVWDTEGLAPIAVPLGGMLGLTTHGTKLGMRYAIDASPEPITNGAANIAELSIVSALVIGVWQHPYIALGVALAILILLLLLVRAIWVGIARTVRSWRSGGTQTTAIR